MRRVAALLRKELWQHGLVVLALLFLVVGIDALLLAGALLAPRTMTLLETHASFTRFFLPIVALALGHRLVVREYQQGTQRFLEALPLSRIEVVLSKLGLGLAVLSAAALGSLLVSCAVALLRGEPLTIRWLAVVALKTELFVLALWSVLFTIGLLGRFRVPAYLAALFALYLLDEATDVDLGHLGPFALVGERFVLERESIVPAEALATLAVVTVALGIALALALAKEGAVAEVLARRMSPREKVAVGAVLVFAMMGGEIASDVRDDEPFSFEGEAVLRRADPPLEVLYLEAPSRPAAEALADLLAADLASMREALAIEALPRVHVALRETLGPREVQLVDLEDGGSVLVRAAFTAEGFDREALRAAVLARVLERVTDGRAAFEPYAWARSGFARAWAHRDGADDREVRRRALFVARSRRPSFALLERWERTEERFGPAAAEALAYAAMRALEEEAGRERWLAFARTVVGRPPPLPGIAAVVHHRLRPVSARMREATGVTPEALERALIERVLAWRRDPALRGAPRARGHVAIEPAGGELYGVRWRAAFEGPPPPGATCSLLHAALGPFDAPLASEELFREERSCAALAPEGELLVGRYGPGERVLAAVELDDPSLGAPVRIASARLEVPR